MFIYSPCPEEKPISVLSNMAKKSSHSSLRNKAIILKMRLSSYLDLSFHNTVMNPRTLLAIFSSLAEAVDKVGTI